jgi:hypothetical protein
MSTERRQQKRLAHPLEGSWRGASGATQCRISDISATGCFVQGLAQPASGERTKIVIEFGEGDAVTLNGEVVYAERGMGFALRFVDVDPEVGTMLASRIDALEALK